MQKTEKHCKNQCFCYYKTTKISPKTGPKTQKSASEPGHLRNRKKRCCKPKNWGQKVEKHVFFFTFRLPILDGRVHEQVSSVLFFTMFFKGERHDLSKTGGFGRKMFPPADFTMFWPSKRSPSRQQRAPKRSKIDVQNHLLILAPSFHKRKKIQQGEGFRAMIGGRGAPAGS